MKGSEHADPLDLLSVGELVELLSVGETSVRGWIASGELPSVKLGKRRLVPRMAAEEFVRRQMHNGKGPADK